MPQLLARDDGPERIVCLSAAPHCQRYRAGAPATPLRRRPQPMFPRRFAPVHQEKPAMFSGESPIAAYPATH
jgi:hypothetical protein